MNKNIINFMFLLLSFFLVFNNIPKIIQFNFFGGEFGNKLSVYLIFLGFIYTGYCQYKYKNIFKNFNIFLKFISIYSLITFISLIIGLYNFPYYDLVTNSPVAKIEKLSYAIDIFNNFGINIDTKSFTVIWFIVRAIRGVLFEALYAFCGAYMIYCWYYDDWRTAFYILVKGVLLSLLILFSYSFVEIFYLAGNKNAKNILEIITPYFHIIASGGSAWPPLLWKNQLRSVFAEPSYYGIYFAFAMPILWYVFFVTKSNVFKLFSVIGIVFFTFALFLTQARTAVALFIGEIVLLFIIILILRNKAMLLKYIALILCSVFAFGLSNMFILNYMMPEAIVSQKTNENTNNLKKESSELKIGDNKVQPIISKKINSTHNESVSKDIKTKKNNVNILNKKQINKYFEKNLFSLASLEKRSNNTRYSNMISDLKIGMDYPFFGVGSSLRIAYKEDYFPEMARNNKEIKRWFAEFREKGLLSTGFPRIEYTSRLAENGILGLIIFLIPPFYLLKNLYCKITNKIYGIHEKVPVVFFVISFMGIIASGLGDSINITYCYWVLLGLGYAICFGKTNSKEREMKQNHG